MPSDWVFNASKSGFLDPTTRYVRYSGPEWSIPLEKPQLGGGAQGALDPQIIEAVLDPALEPRPFAQERFVRQLRRAFAHRHQPRVREHVQQGLGLGAHIGQREPAALDASLVADLDELEEH